MAVGSSEIETVYGGRDVSLRTPSPVAIGNRQEPYGWRRDEEFSCGLARWFDGFVPGKALCLGVWPQKWRVYQSGVISFLLSGKHRVRAVVIIGDVSKC